MNDFETNELPFDMSHFIALILYLFGVRFGLLVLIGFYIKTKQNKNCVWRIKYVLRLLIFTFLGVRLFIVIPLKQIFTCEKTLNFPIFPKATTFMKFISENEFQECLQNGKFIEVEMPG